MFAASWQPQFAKVKKAFALLELRSRKGTLVFEPGTPALNLFTVPPEIRGYVLQALMEQYKAEFGWKEDDFDPASDQEDVVDVERPNFDIGKDMQLWETLFMAVF